MPSWSNRVSPRAGRGVVIGLGGGYIALGLAILGTGLTQGRPLSNVLLVSLFITVPGMVLLYGGYRLPLTGILPRFYPTVAAWCLGGLALMAASVALYQFEPAESISEPGRAVLVFTAFGTLAGFAVGSRDAAARTYSLALEHRNEQLERTEAKLQDTVEELEATNDQLAESNERLEQFAYAVSHDLREPLRMVSSYLQLLDRRYHDVIDEDGREFLEFAVDGAARMRAMVDGLLDLSRVETSGDSFEPIDLNEVMREVQRDLELQIAETDATVEVAELPRVEGDRNQLHQLFQNLLSNALEYSGEDPPQVRIAPQGNRGSKTIVAVRDEGIGMEPEAVDHIFDAFQRLHTHDEHPGTGIGLTLCRRIVARHGGDIWVESEPGMGSTFFVTLQRA